jgi:hypothetical protein
MVIWFKLRREDCQTLQDLTQFFWSTTRQPESEAASERFPVPVSQNTRWRGTLTEVRLDPTNEPGATAELDSIRLK